VVQILGHFRVGKVPQGFLMEFQFAELFDLFHFRKTSFRKVEKQRRELYYYLSFSMVWIARIFSSPNPCKSSNVSQPSLINLAKTTGKREYR